MQKKFITIVVALIFLIPIVLVGKAITVKKIGATKSAVTFNHDQHKTYNNKGAKVKCKDCHHKGQMKDSCSKCHKNPKGKAALHKNCIDQCHKAQNKGPKACKQCHK